MSWYCVQTHARAEEKAHANLEAQGYVSYLPSQLKRIAHARRITWARRPLFPRYLFVRVEENEAWRPIRSTFGVTDIIAFGEKPTPVPESLIAELKQAEDADGLIVIGRHAQFERGQSVEISDGPLAGQAAIFDCVADHERVFILLDLLNRQVRVRVPVGTISVSA
jgi:transcriptional antiterminator RfaH